MPLNDEPATPPAGAEKPFDMRLDRHFQMHLKMRQLLLVIALDDYRHLRRAAEALHMTQPGASRRRHRTSARRWCDMPA